MFLVSLHTKYDIASHTQQILNIVFIRCHYR